MPLSDRSSPSASESDVARETELIRMSLGRARAMRRPLVSAKRIDAIQTPRSYEIALEMLDTLIGDLDAMADTREWHDVDTEWKR